nr:isoprenylcysteine carboxyl methyltransferase family protein [Cellulomonas marina]
MLWFDLLVLGTGLERLAELVVSARNARWSFERGGVESGRGHFPPMVALHTGLLLACVLEVHLADRPFVPPLAWAALALVIASQALRWWCIATLGPRWNTRVIVVPGLPLVSRGPYRWIPHPNYVAVVVEGIALPLVHTAWVTALVFTVLNAVLLLRFRIPAEERALAAAVGATRTP